MARNIAHMHALTPPPLSLSLSLFLSLSLPLPAKFQPFSFPFASMRAQCTDLSVLLICELFAYDCHEHVAIRL